MVYLSNYGTKKSTINENFLNEQEPNQNIQQITNDPNFENNLEKSLSTLVKDISNEIPQITQQVGDKDDELEPINQSIGESLNNINEAGLGALAIGTALAAPKIVEMIGKGIEQLGGKVDINVIKNVGEKLSHGAHKLHQTYINLIKRGLKLSPKMRGLEDKDLELVATGVLLAITVALGIQSVMGLASAVKAGHAGLAAVEGGLSGVKFSEILGGAKTIIPRVLNGIFK